MLDKQHYDFFTKKVSNMWIFMYFSDEWLIFCLIVTGNLYFSIWIISTKSTKILQFFRGVRIDVCCLLESCFVLVYYRHKARGLGGKEGVAFLLATKNWHLCFDLPNIIRSNILVIVIWFNDSVFLLRCARVHCWGSRSIKSQNFQTALGGGAYNLKNPWVTVCTVS